MSNLIKPILREKWRGDVIGHSEWRGDVIGHSEKGVGQQNAN